MPNANTSQPSDSASPADPYADKLNLPDPDLSSGPFGVSNPSMPASSVPGPIAGQSPESLATNTLAATTARGDSAIAAKAGSSSSGSSGGGILGSLFSIGSKILPAFLAQGGPVGLAEGGSVDNHQAVATSLGLGYILGALHQDKYGGTPDTLPQAADELKQHLGSSQGFASGGEASSDSSMAQVSLMKSLGLIPGSEDQSGTQTSQNTQMSGNTANAISASQSGQADSGQVAQGAYQPTAATQPATQQQSGYVQKFAMGGPEDPGQAPTLKPGQTFQGDGSVKGPGGPTDDAIPARLSNGEFVMSAPAVQFFGVDKLVKMNEQGKQGFMQALGQVDANQQQAPGGAPGGPPGQPQPQPPAMPAQNSMPPAGPSMQQPQMLAAKKGGYIRTKGSGFMGL